MVWLYALLCVLGTVLPYAQFVPFLMENGLDVPLIFEQLFGTRIAAFFGWDVIVSVLVLLLFIFVEGRRQGVRPLWLPVLATLTVGVSLGLPLFLLMREHTLAQQVKP